MTHRGLVVAAGCLVVSFWTRPAEADGAYGRLGGDLDVQASAGPSIGHGSALGVSASALYLVCVGPYAGAEVALSEKARVSGGGALRSLSTGVEIRPLFIPRFFTASETGRSFFDLLVDSVGGRMGARFFPGSPLRAFELSAVVDVPIGTRFSGAFLALSATKILSPRALAGQSTGGERSFFFGIALGLRGMLTTHLVDVNDGRER